MQFASLFYFELKKENKSKRVKQTYFIGYKKKAPIVFNWRLLAVVISTGQISTKFMEDLKRLAYYW